MRNSSNSWTSESPGRGEKRNIPSPGRPLIQQVWGGAWESTLFEAASGAAPAFRKHCLTSMPFPGSGSIPCKGGDVVCYQLPFSHPRLPSLQLLLPSRPQKRVSRVRFLTAAWRPPGTGEKGQFLGTSPDLPNQKLWGGKQPSALAHIPRQVPFGGDQDLGFPEDTSPLISCVILDKMLTNSDPISIREHCVLICA